MKDCLFCKIVNGEIPSFEIYEDERVIAILDLYPITKGQTLVITKQHHSSKFSNLENETLINLIESTQKVAKGIESSLENVERCQLVFEGFHVDHIHAKLFPAYLPNPSNDSVVSMGEKANSEELAKLQSQIKI